MNRKPGWFQAKSEGVFYALVTGTVAAIFLIVLLVWTGRIS